MMSEPLKKKQRTNSILNYFSSINAHTSDITGDHTTDSSTSVNPEPATNDNGAMSDQTATAAKKHRVQEPEKNASTSSAMNTSSKTEPHGMNDAEASTSGAMSSLKTDSTLQYESDMSPILFTDSEPTSDSQRSTNSTCSRDIPVSKPRVRRENSSVWKGVHPKELHRSPECSPKLPALTSTPSHTVLFKTPHSFSDHKPPVPHSKYHDGWDANHVRMPCSNLNEYPVQAKKGSTHLKRRWDMIEEALLQPIPGPFELEEAILTYNNRYSGKWDFTAMHYFFTDTLEKEERNYFFETTLKRMVALALQLPSLCTLPIPLLKKGKEKTITLSQQQIACLLANAFFCTYPRRNARQRHSEYRDYPTINFNTIFQGQPHKTKMEKMKCIVHYFKRVTNSVPTGTVTFTRQVINKMPFWEDSEIKLRKLHVSSDGTIEDNGTGMLQVDFANKYVGGGVMGMGCVQEEIRFLINPEMLVTRLFTEVLDKDECLIMKGCERFSNYEGYASTFVWSGNHCDKTKRDRWGRICTEVVAIDALVFNDFEKQFQKRMVERELSKAFAGFHTSESSTSEQIPAVCTGNWGCGAFGGDKRLKALIQLMAAAQAKRDVCYLTFDDTNLRDDLYKIHEYLTVTNPLGIGNILKLIEQYRANKIIFHVHKPKMNLFQYIVAVFDGTMESSDEEEDFGSMEMQQIDEVEASSVQEACVELDWGDVGDSVTPTTFKNNFSETDFKANTP